MLRRRGSERRRGYPARVRTHRLVRLVLLALLALLPWAPLGVPAASADVAPPPHPRPPVPPPPPPPLPPTPPPGPMAAPPPAAPPIPPPAPPPPVVLSGLLADRAAAWGLPVFECRRLTAIDLDGDGRADLVVNAGERVFLNRPGEGGVGARFEELPGAGGLHPEKGRGADVVAFGDVDGDGDVDCFYGRNGDFAAEAKKAKDDGLRSEIRLNDGKGHFTVKEGSGVGALAETTSAATFVDVDGDGVLDLFVGNWYVRYGEDLECFPSRLFHGRGDGTFEDVTEKAGLLGVAEPGRRDSRRPVYGVTHLDFDDDGDQDLVACAYGRQWNQLWRNDGGGTFTDVAEAVGFDGDDDESGVYPAEIRKDPRLKDREDEKPFRSNGNTFDAPAADFDGDGDLDVFLGEITHWWAGPSSDRSNLLVNPGGAGGWKFTREERGIVRTHEAARWNQGDIFAGWIDLGSDGLEDLFIASGDYPDDQRLRFFVQGADHRFTDGTKELAVDWANCSQPTVADFDLDGTADLALGNSNVRATPEQSRARTLRAAIFAQTRGKHFLRVVLEGKGPGGANRDAIGAKVTVRAGRLAATRVVFGSRGCGGHADERALTIGLGDATRVDELVVSWPDAARSVQRFTGLEVDRVLRIRQGEPPRSAPR